MVGTVAQMLQVEALDENRYALDRGRDTPHPDQCVAAG